jgi:hypothetical protein
MAEEKTEAKPKPSHMQAGKPPSWLPPLKVDPGWRPQMPPYGGPLNEPVKPPSK